MGLHVTNMVINEIPRIIMPLGDLKEVVGVKSKVIGKG